MNEELKLIAEAYTKVLHEAVSTYHHTLLGSKGYEPHHPGLLPGAYSKKGDHTDMITINKDTFVHKEPSGLIHQGPIKSLETHFGRL